MADDSRPQVESPAPNAAGGRNGPAVDVRRLVEEHSAALYRYAYRLSGSVADAEDLTQQTFLIAHQKLSQLRDPVGAQAWLFAVLRHAYLRLARKTRPLPAGVLGLDIDSIPAEGVEDLAIDQELLQAAIDELPDEFKLVVVSFYFEECSYKEIADRLGVPVGTVMSRLSRAKGHLRSRLFESEFATAAGRAPATPTRTK